MSSTRKLIVGLDPGLAATGLAVCVLDEGKLTLIDSQTFEEKLPNKESRVDDFWDWPQRSFRQWNAIRSALSMDLGNADMTRLDLIIGMEDFHVYRNVNKGAMDTAKFVGFLFSRLAGFDCRVRLWTNPTGRSPVMLGWK